MGTELFVLQALCSQHVCCTALISIVNMFQIWKPFPEEAICYLCGSTKIVGLFFLLMEYEHIKQLLHCPKKSANFLCLPQKKI